MQSIQNLYDYDRYLPDPQHLSNTLKLIYCYAGGVEPRTR